MTKYLICLLFCLCTPLIADCHVFDEKLFLDHLKNNPTIEQLYYPNLNGTLLLIDRILHDPHRSIDAQCSEHLNQLRRGLLAKERWALLCEYITVNCTYWVPNPNTEIQTIKLIQLRTDYESNGFPKDGRLNGDYSNLGYFDQCLSVPEREMRSGHRFETKFCLISVSTPEWSDLVHDRRFARYFSPLQESTKEMFKFNYGKIFGLCLPSSCDTDAVLESANRMLLPPDLRATSQRFCSTTTKFKSNQPYAITEIVAL